MERKQLVYVVRCAHCDKPFHITATSKSDDAGDEEIVLNCPYCEKANTVAVPRPAIEQVTLVRGIAPELKSRKAS